MKAVHARIYGRVQGVFFRASTQEKAQALGLSGWVCNRRDGSVEVFAQGEDAAVDALVEWLHRGPPLARVDRVDLEPAAIDASCRRFEMRPTA